MKKVSFKKDLLEIIEFKTENCIKEERRERVKKISQQKETNRSISRVLYKCIPTPKEYIELFKYNKKVKKKIRKKIPLRKIKINEDKGGQWDYLIEEIQEYYFSECNIDGGFIHIVFGTIDEKFYFNNKSKTSKLLAIYEAKIFLIEEHKNLCYSLDIF